MTPAQERQLMVISHSHWDREWYLPFEAFRARLVGMLDRLLHLLETNPDYKHFMLDGQSIILEDYQGRQVRGTQIRVARGEL